MEQEGEYLVQAADGGKKRRRGLTAAIHQDRFQSDTACAAEIIRFAVADMRRMSGIQSMFL